MKKQIRTFLLSGMAAILAVSSLTACTDSDQGKARGLYQDAADPADPADPDKPGGSYYADIPEDELFLIVRNTNGAWYHEDNGFAVYTNGAVYGFNFDTTSWTEYDGEGVGLVDSLEYIRENTKPSCNLGEEFVKKAYAYGMAIDPDAGFKTENMACDMGQTTLYFINGGDEIKVYSAGDNNYDPKDKNAKKLQKLWHDTVIPNRDQVSFYSGSETPLLNLHCGYMDELEGRYFLKNEEELFKFSSLARISAAMVAGQISEYEKEYMSYFVEIQNVTSGGYDLKACAIMKDGGRYSFVMSKDNVVPGAYDTVASVMDGFCFAAAYPGEVDANVAEADGWMSYEDAVKKFGWKEDGIITGTMYVNPGLSLSADGGAEIYPYDYEGDIPAATVYAPDMFYLDTESSYNECVVFRREDDSSMCFKVYSDIPGDDNDYYYYDIQPGPDFKFEEYGLLGMEVNGHDLLLMERINPYIDEEQDVFYVYYMYGDPDNPYTLCAVIPLEMWDKLNLGNREIALGFMKQLFYP